MRPHATCRQLIDDILAYFEGDLDPIERSAFERHMERCSSCRAYVQTYDQTIRMTQMLKRMR